MTDPYTIATIIATLIRNADLIVCGILGVAAIVLLLWIERQRRKEIRKARRES